MVPSVQVISLSCELKVLYALAKQSSALSLETWAEAYVQVYDCRLLCQNTFIKYVKHLNYKSNTDRKRVELNPTPLVQ